MVNTGPTTKIANKARIKGIHSCHSEKRCLAIKKSISVLPKTELDKLTTGLVSQGARFVKQPFLFSWWIHGGEPGHQSDFLKLKSVDGKLVGEFVRSMFNPQLNPPYVTKKYTAIVPSNRVVEILQEMLAVRLFAEEFPEEKDPGVCDILKETWKFECVFANVEKTMYEPFSRNLNRLRALCRDLINEIK